ncbi:glycosyl hydrolase family 28-related protein [Acetobacter sp. AC2005]|uniref:glycosyl hydrolase family 28-related protein n=1 Tax=Acetobacter sp. AC2005 TaxID=3134142 RepID=UPI0030D0A45C
MRKYILLAAFLPSICFAQSVPQMDRRVTLEGPTGLNWALSTKVDTLNGTLNSPEISGGDISNSSISGGTSAKQEINQPTISDGTAIGLDVSSALGKVLGASVSRYLNSKLLDIISVRDFGAKGDGVTDDTAAINAAISYAHTTNNKGGRIFFPDGVYNVSSTIILTGSGFSLIGTSPRAATIQSTVTSGNIIQIGQSPDNLNNNQNDQIFGLNIISQNPMTSGAAIYADGVYNLKIDNVRIGENIFDGLEVENSIRSTYGVMIHHLWLASILDKGIIIGALAQTQQQVVTDVFLSDSMILPAGSSAICGVCLYGAGGFYASGVDITSNGDSHFINAMHIKPNAGSDVNAVMLSRFLMDDSTDENLLLDGDGFIADVTLTNVWASTSNTASGIVINNTNTDGFTISGSTVDSNAQNGITINGGVNISVSSSRILNNSMSSNGSFNGIAVGVQTGKTSPASYSITDNQIGNGGFFNLNGGSPSIIHQKWGINIDKLSGQGFVVTNNRGFGNVSGIINDQTTGTNKTVSGNVSG